MLVRQVFFTEEVYFLKNLLFLVFILGIILSLFVDVALKVVLMVWFPRSWTHITKWLTAATWWSTKHKVATCRSFDVSVTEWTDFSVQWEPFGICFFLLDDVSPSSSFLTLTWSVDRVPAFETESRATFTPYIFEAWILAVDAFIAVCTWTKFHVRIALNVLFTKIFRVLL